MKKCRITALRKTEYPDLMEQYENPLETPCTVSIGQVWVTNGWEKPADFCESAWNTLSPFVMALAHGGENFYDGWMKIRSRFCCPVMMDSVQSAFWLRHWKQMGAKDEKTV